VNTPEVRSTRRLVCTDATDVEAFERAFYRGFEHVTHNRLVRWLWDWDHEARRLRTRIPYADQQIWVMTGNSDDIWAAIAVNTRLVQLQGAAFGFEVPVNLREAASAGRVCEFLTLFAVGDPSLNRKLPLWREVFPDLLGMGFTHALATTAPRLLGLYRWIHAEIVGTTRIEGEERVFLQFDLSRTRRHRRG
jgi:hypothetical protein